MSGDLGVEALDEEVSMDAGGVPLPTLAPNTNHLESSASTWYKGKYPLCRRLPLCVQADIQR